MHIRSTAWRTRVIAALAILASVNIVLASDQAIAVPVNYDETVDGDINPLDFGESSPMNFDYGTNTVSGSTLRIPGDTIDSDRFYFDVPSGASVDAVTFSVTGLEVYGTPTHAGYGTSLHLGVPFSSPANFRAGPVEDPTFVDQGSQVLTAPADFEFVGAYPFYDPIYKISATSFFTVSGPGQGYLLDYTYTIAVGGGPVVPEPSSYAMGMLGLIGLGFYGWRRRHYRQRA